MLKSTANQPEFVDFYLPFNGRLLANNRWVARASMIPWDEVEEVYRNSFCKTGGREALPARVAFGALVIQSTQNLTDEETVAQISENPYLQYFLGFKEFKQELPFNSSMMVHFRKRFGKDGWNRLNDLLVKRAIAEESDSDETDSDGGGSSVTHSGKLVIDASCVPSDIRHPTDLGLLKDARQGTERLIDQLYEHCRDEVAEKPRTRRHVAKRRYGAVARQKRARVATIRKECRWQLNTVERNLVSLSRLSDICGLETLPFRDRQRLQTIVTIYYQQCAMVREGDRTVDERIYSLHQPHIRAIYRGKANHDYEFGAKISVGLGKGYAFLDRLSWAPYNECHDLISQLTAYRSRFGCFPESIHADKIYRTRSNIKLCVDLGIRLTALPLGRPGPDHADKLAQLSQDERDRNAVEGKLGQLKRRFGLDRILTRLTETSESAIAAAFFVSNLLKWEARVLFAFILSGWQQRCLPLTAVFVQTMFESIRKNFPMPISKRSAVCFRQLKIARYPAFQ